MGFGMGKTAFLANSKLNEGAILRIVYLLLMVSDDAIQDDSFEANQLNKDK